MDIYIAKEGDTVWDTAKRCNLSPRRLAADNGLSPTAPLATGQALTVRRVRTFHTVRRGETVRDIAARYGVTVRAVYRMNPALCGVPRIGAGQTLAVQMTHVPKKHVQVLGLVSPCPAPLSLPAVLPFLTYVAPYTCRTAKNGGLQIPDTDFLFAAARDYGVLPLLHIDGVATAVHRFAETAFYAVTRCNAAGVVADTETVPLTARLTGARRLSLKTFPAIHTFGCDCQNGKPPVFLSPKGTFALAVRHNAAIRFDDTANRPYFCYRDSENAVHTVWFYDQRSWLTHIQHADGITVQSAENNVSPLVFLSACRRIVE